MHDHIICGRASVHNKLNCSCTCTCIWKGDTCTCTSKMSILFFFTLCSIWTLLEHLNIKSLHMHVQYLQELNWLPFPIGVQYHTCLMVYKSITRQAPEYIYSMLTYVSEHHKGQTMSTVLDLLHIPRSHSAYFDRAFSVQGPKLWNSLPADIRNSTSISRFKCELKRYLLYNNYNGLKFCCISNKSPATVRCGVGIVFWTKARSTLALPVWRC